MKLRLLSFAASLLVLGSCSASSLVAQTRPALVQDVDEAARSAFSARLFMEWNGRGGNAVADIPAGYRLAVDYLWAAGYSDSETAGPAIVVNYVLSGKRTELVFFPQQLPHVPTSYSLSEKVTIYADQLWAYTIGVQGDPNTQFFNLVVVGHLVKIP